MSEDTVTTEPAPLVAAAPTTLVKLDLAGGQNVKEGFECVDKFAPNAKHKIDLWKFPWPFEDNSVDELHCSHHVEHIPARDVDGRDLRPNPNLGIYPFISDRYLDRDMFLAFFDECHRILKPGGIMTVITPCARSNRAFQDPTHRRFIVAETFHYLSKEWRVSQGLDHYLGAADFLLSIGHTMMQELSLLHPEAQARRFNESWNTIWDWVVTLKAIK